MQGTEIGRRLGAPAVIGLSLVLAGLGALMLRQIGVEVGDVIGEGGWPFFVIIPGLILLAAAFVPAPPRGIGFAIGGSIATTVGLILLYQQTTDHWESWAYAWSLLPLAAGLALAVYGFASRNREFTSIGMWLAGFAAVLFVAGFWFFETVFESGRAPLDLGTWWPAILVGVGALIIGKAVVGSSRVDRRE